MLSTLEPESAYSAFNLNLVFLSLHPYSTESQRERLGQFKAGEGTGSFIKKGVFPGEVGRKKEPPMHNPVPESLTKQGMLVSDGSFAPGAGWRTQTLGGAEGIDSY